MVGVRATLLVERLEVRGEVVDPLCVEEFADDVRRLEIADRFDELGDRTVVIPLLIEVLGVFSENCSDGSLIVLLVLSQSHGNSIEALAEKALEFGLSVLEFCCCWLNWKEMWGERC